MNYILVNPVSLVLQNNALNYFFNLIKLSSLEKEVNLRLFVFNPCTDKAQINLIYCYLGEEVLGDLSIKIGKFNLYIEKNSFSALFNASIIYLNNKLVIHAPNAKGKNIFKNISFKKKILILLEKDVNPLLSAHGGFVKLVGTVGLHTILLEFGGTCTGCGLLSSTLENTIKKIIKRNFPKVKKILDYSKILNKKKY